MRPRILVTPDLFSNERHNFCSLLLLFFFFAIGREIEKSASSVHDLGLVKPKGQTRLIRGVLVFFRYYTALERTLFYDHVPTDRQMELWEVNCKVHRRGLELIKPGVRCSEIAKELNELFLEHDLLKYRTFGYGHSFGVLCHYYGREAGLEIREDVETVLQPNMVISMEPMITIPEGELGAGGYREHDILVVKETDSEDITKFPFGPEHNIIKN